MTDDPFISGLDERIEALQHKDRDLKKERQRLEDAIKDNRQDLYALVRMKKGEVVEPAASK